MMLNVVTVLVAIVTSSAAGGETMLCSLPSVSLSASSLSRLNACDAAAVSAPMCDRVFNLVCHRLCLDIIDLRKSAS